MTVRRGHITFKRDGYVGSLSLGGDGLGRGAAHQETAGMFGGGGHFGEGAVVEGRGGFLERQQSRFIGDIVDRGIGDSIKLYALAGCASGKCKSSFLGRDFREGEVTPYDQAAVRVETEQRDRRQRFLSCLGRRGRIGKGAGGVRFIGKRYGDLSLSRNRRIHFVRFLAARGKPPSGQHGRNPTFHLRCF